MYDFLEEFYDMLHDCASSDESQAPLECGENLTRSEPQNIWGCWADIDTCLPWYSRDLSSYGRDGIKCLQAAGQCAETRCRSRFLRQFVPA